MEVIGSRVMGRPIVNSRYSNKTGGITTGQTSFTAQHPVNNRTCSEVSVPNGHQLPTDPGEDDINSVLKRYLGRPLLNSRQSVSDVWTEDDTSSVDELHSIQLKEDNKRKEMPDGNSPLDFIARVRRTIAAQTEEADLSCQQQLQRSSSSSSASSSVLRRIVDTFGDLGSTQQERSSVESDPHSQTEHRYSSGRESSLRNTWSRSKPFDQPLMNRLAPFVSSSSLRSEEDEDEDTGTKSSNAEDMFYNPDPEQWKIRIHSAGKCLKWEMCSRLPKKTLDEMKRKKQRLLLRLMRQNRQRELIRESIEKNLPKPSKEKASGPRHSILLNALDHSVFPGPVHRERKKRILNEMACSESKAFLILFRHGCGQFRALYSFSPRTEETVKLYGKGPKKVTHDMCTNFFKYNTAAKRFVDVPTKYISLAIDAFNIHEGYWKATSTVPK